MRTGLLRSRVARRVLLTFLVGAVAPVTLMAGLSFRAVTKQLGDQSRERLDRLAKSTGMATMERLWWAHGLTRQAAGRIDDGVPLPAGLVGLVRTDGDAVLATQGHLGPIPQLSSETLDRLAERPVVRLAEEGSPPDLLLALVGPGPGTVLWGRVRADSVWTRVLAAAELPTTSGACITDPAGAPIACGMDVATDLAETLSASRPDRGLAEHRVGGDRHLVAQWEVFLPGSFDAEPLWVAVSESRSSTYAPLRAFAWSFPLALLLGVSMIGLLSHVQIRRTLDPLSRLAEGTERIARGDLDGRVEVTTHDEFAELASSFNTMADQLQERFAVLAAGRHIDEVALAEADHDRVLEALLKECHGVFRGQRLALAGPDKTGRWCRLAVLGPGDESADLENAPPMAHLKARIEAYPAAPTLLVDHRTLEELGPLGFDRNDTQVTLVPLRVSGQVAGVLIIGGHDESQTTERMVNDALSLVGHASLGVQSARLFTELEEMSWGTIRALARAIDAKSPWTAGHSERVTALAVELGRTMGLDAAALTLLERGGLLHDVGKIGIPAAILDYPGALTEEQFSIMKRHPVIGAEILEPIAAFRAALPLVRSHHEKWNGSGYPDGLSGYDIDPLARILTVADVFDAMVSERPYRAAMDVDLVHSFICKEAGTSFDPAPVEALSHVLEKGWCHAEATFEELTRVP